MQKKLVNVLITLSLIIGGCSTTNSIVSYKAYPIPDSREVIKVEPTLLTIKPLRELPNAVDMKSINNRAIILGSDLADNRTQLVQLVGAVKQREYSEEAIVKAEKKRAVQVQEIIKELNNQELNKKEPWYKKIF